MPLGWGEICPTDVRSVNAVCHWVAVRSVHWCEKARALVGFTSRLYPSISDVPCRPRHYSVKLAYQWIDVSPSLIRCLVGRDVGILELQCLLISWGRIQDISSMLESNLFDTGYSPVPINREGARLTELRVNGPNSEVLLYTMNLWTWICSFASKWSVTKTPTVLRKVKGLSYPVIATQLCSDFSSTIRDHIKQPV